MSYNSFHFDNSENQDPNNAPYKFYPKKLTGKNVDFIDFAIFSYSSHF